MESQVIPSLEGTTMKVRLQRKKARTGGSNMGRDGHPKLLSTSTKAHLSWKNWEELPRTSVNSQKLAIPKKIPRT